MVHVLHAGTAVQDLIYRFDDFPRRGSKARAKDFAAVGGGMAANAAVAVSRLGGTAHLVTPLGDDRIGDMILDDLKAEGVDVSRVLRIAGFQSPINAAIVDGSGERTILTWRAAMPQPPVIADPQALLVGMDAVLVDDRFPSMAVPLLEAARARGIPAVLDGDRPEGETGPIIHAATHIAFSRAGLAGTSGIPDPEAGLRMIRARTDAFLAVTLGAEGLLWLDGDRIRHLAAFPVTAVDTLGAGDVFHGAFALALAEGQAEAEALRFGAAVSALKCTRFGGRRATPHRDEIWQLLKV